MPRKSAIKCYFRCETKGPFHQFPKPQANIERFKQWKMVLSENVIDKGDSYIYNNIRLCDRHFKAAYCSSASKRLTSNAVPTLNITSPLNAQSHHISTAVEMGEMDAKKNFDSCQLQIEDNAQDVAYCSASKQLTSNAFPTLNITSPLNAQSRQLQREDHAQDEAQTNSTKENRLFKGTIQTHKCFKNEKLLKVRILKLKKKCKTLHQEVRLATKLSKSQVFLKNIEKLPEPAAIFSNMQLRKSLLKPRGRRFSTKEKVLCLTIYKQSQKGYNLLQRLFTLPSKRTLQKMLSSITLTPGINETIIEHLRKAAKNLPEEKKLCTLIFDEVALTPGLYYQKTCDEIVGFEDFGVKRTTRIADHALVFMLKGLKGKYKQPIFFSFCQSATKSADLKKLVIEVIQKVNTTGLKIIATVCDQSSTNMCVINSLLNDTKEKYLRSGEEFRSLAFEIDETKIFPIFDPPHVLKGLRNNLMTKDLEYQQNGETKVAKWTHLQMLLDADNGDDDIRLVNKITETHINKDKVPKMKVKHAAQVFSQRVSAAMRFLSNHNILPKECLATADLLLIIDKLFDSFNGHSYQGCAKTYKTALKKKSPHFKLWNEALPVLNSMKFVTETKRYVTVPSIKNWISNIKVMTEMFEHLNKKHDISSLLTRNINQDPLENFFCNIRSNGIRNISPTCSQFVGAYKTILVNNLTSPHSVGANCERDDNKILKPIKCLLKMKSKTRKEHGEINVDSLMNLCEMVNTEPSNIISKESKRYVAGYVVHKCIKKISYDCITCKRQLLSTTPPRNNDYILQRDYTNKSCKYPSEALCSFLDDVYLIIKTQLNEEPHEKNIKYVITQKVIMFCDFMFLSCDKHKKKLYDNLINIIVNVIVHSWCTNVNRLLKGKMSRADNDKIKIQAVNYFKRHVKRKK